MCEIPKIPKIYDYNGDKMGIIQNEVVWNKNTGGGGGGEFRYHSKNTRHRENSNFRYAQ